MSTLKSLSFSVDIECDFHVDIKNVDLINSTRVKDNIEEPTLCGNFMFAKLYFLMSLMSTNKI